MTRRAAELNRPAPDLVEPDELVLVARAELPTGWGRDRVAERSAKSDSRLFASDFGETGFSEGVSVERRGERLTALGERA